MTGEVKQFATDGREQISHDIIYPRAYYYNEKTYIAVNGALTNPYVTVYRHATGAFDALVKAGDTGVINDSHGNPAIIRSMNGYLHIFFGCHATSIKHNRSLNPDDITSWVAKANISGTLTYPNVVMTSAGVIWLFARGRTSGYANDNEGNFFISTDNGETFGAINVFVKTNNNSCWYIGNVALDEAHNRIYVVWCLNTGTGKRYNVYVCYIDLTSKHVFNMQGTDLGTQISEAVAEASCKIYNSGTWEVINPHIRLNPSDGIPCVIFCTCETWTSAVYRYTRWTGSAWTSAMDITTTDHVFNNADMIVHSLVDIEAYLCGTGLAGYGGDVEKWHYDGNSWSKIATLLTEIASGRALGNIQIVDNYVKDLKVIFGQQKWYEWTTPLKGYAWIEPEVYYPPSTAKEIIGVHRVPVDIIPTNIIY